MGEASGCWAGVGGEGKGGVAGLGSGGCRGGALVKLPINTTERR